MGQCFGTKRSSNEIAQKSHKQIELHLREDQGFKQRVFFTGNHECIANIFGTIDTDNSMHQIRNCSHILITGYIRNLQIPLQIPSDLQSLCTKFYGRFQFPNHYEFYPKVTINTNPLPPQSTSAPLISPSNSDHSVDDKPFGNHLQYPSIPIPSDTEDTVDKHIEYHVNFPNYAMSKKQQTSQLMITYHNLQCFKKKDYYLKWIHLLDNSLSVIFVADLSQIGTNHKLLLKDMERFRRLMYYSNGKYDAKMPILVLSGIDKFNQYLRLKTYRKRFEAQFKSFQFDDDGQHCYYQHALQHIKNQYLLIFENNTRNGSDHWTNRRRQPHKLFIRTINDVDDMYEVQRVWVKLNKALIHGNIMRELRNGGIAV